MRKPTRSEISRDNKRKADALEADLVAQNDYLLKLGLADVEKVPDPVKITSRRGGTVTGRTLARSTVDFTGVIKGGLAVAFDAKVTSHETRFDFSALESRPKSANARTQREILASYAAFGAAAFVYVRHECDIVRTREYLFPVEADGTVAGIRSKRSISFTNGEARPYLVGRDQTWYDKLRELMRRRRGIEDAASTDDVAPPPTRRDGAAPDVEEVNDSAAVRRLCTTK